ncbi:hypothetical protein [Acinetobacter baumannii]|uniref:hypothetical protein n=1 Tax=Acinetobacter baumannii TaxID=470 RepID=UPI0037368229
MKNITDSIIQKLGLITFEELEKGDLEIFTNFDTCKVIIKEIKKIGVKKKYLKFCSMLLTATLSIVTHNKNYKHLLSTSRLLINNRIKLSNISLYSQLNPTWLIPKNAISLPI